VIVAVFITERQTETAWFAQLLDRERKGRGRLMVGKTACEVGPEVWLAFQFAQQQPPSEVIIPPSNAASTWRRPWS
jgi:hypothetical protein